MIVVVGGRGQVARSVARVLADEQHQTKVASRSPSEVDAPVGIDVVPAGGDTVGWQAVLSGARAVFAYADPAGIDPLLDAARASGVHRVVLLSALGIDDAPVEGGGPIVRMHRAAEEAVRDSGLDWTMVRAGGFATNTLQWASSIRENRRVEVAFPEAAAALVHERDVADVAVTALTRADDLFSARALPVTGPRALTQRQQVAAIGDALGEVVELVEISEDHYRDVLARWGDGELVDTLVSVLRSASEHAPPAPQTIADVTGAVPRSFEVWSRDHAVEFR